MAIKSNHRTLGGNVVPRNYKLVITPDLGKFVFEGKEVIDVIIHKPTKSIRLNSKDIAISNAMIKSGKSEQEAKIKYDKKNEEIVLLLKKNVSGDCKISMNYTGTNNDQLYGFYRSAYEENGKKAYLLTTQFEASDARAAFPSFDEPEFKATFDLSLVIDKEFDAISNMLPKTIEKQGSKKKVIFETTPKMACYLLYMGVGKFKFNKAKLGNLLVRAVCVGDKQKYTNMALEFTKKFVAFYEKYFGIKYPLQKIDVIAIPDFAAGAMENWGAVTFRESALLGDEKTSSVAVKQRIAEVIAHELAHQWFGDLVTMKWWDDLWLNESFATFMSYKAMDNTFPSWEISKQFVEEVTSLALGADQLKSTHPISVKVNSPKDIDEIFDTISYEKGGAILSMLENYVGEETFRQGLHIYLKKFEYSNAQKENLWSAIDKAAKAKKQKTDVVRVASSWINTAGYPLVELELYDGNAEVHQSKFTLLNEGKDKTVWPIPLQYIGNPKSIEDARLFEKRNESFAIGKNAKWLKLNHGQKSLYRTRYDRNNLRALGEQIFAKKISAMDAWGIENDLYALARARIETVDEYIDFVEKYCYFPDYPLSSSVVGHLQGLLYLLNGEKIADRLQELIIKYNHHLLKQIGWERKRKESDIATMLRSSLILGLGKAKDAETIKWAESLFNKQMKKGIKIEANLRGVVYAIVAMNGNENVFNTFVRLYKKEALIEEKLRLLGSLAEFSEPKLIKRALEFNMSEDVRMQDSIRIPAISAGNIAAKGFIWPWTKANWKTLLIRYPSGTHMLGRFVGNLSTQSNGKIYKEIEKFFKNKHNFRGDLKKDVKQTLEMIEINRRFVEYQRMK